MNKTKNFTSSSLFRHLKKKCKLSLQTLAAFSLKKKQINKMYFLIELLKKENVKIILWYLLF